MTDDVIFFSVSICFMHTTHKGKDFLENNQENNIFLTIFKMLATTSFTFLLLVGSPQGTRYDHNNYLQGEESVIL